MQNKVALISLGCEKNLVDSEMILGFFKKKKFKIINDLNRANYIIVNTCGFIESAKKEAIDTILEVIDYKKNGAKIIVTGCLVQRYLVELKNEIPEVDLWIPIKDYIRFEESIKGLIVNKKNDLCSLDMNEKVYLTSSKLAYLRIADGCDNRCSYCAIPLIRGNYKSRSIESILNEFKKMIFLDKKKEICIIAQDISAYGKDINQNLSNLLKEILKIEGDYHLRLLYLYPDEITDEFIEVCKNEKIYPYFDIPIQHASDKMLKLMNRRGSSTYIKDLISKIRNNIKNAVIRTTILVGYPYENDDDIKFLLDFLEEVKFDHLGVFSYSKEEDTKGYFIEEQILDSVKEKRKELVYETQRWISLKNNEKYLNKELDVLIEEKDKAQNLYYGRGYMHAPDDIDGLVIVKSDKKLSINTYHKVLIEDIDFYDLIGKVID